MDTPVLFSDLGLSSALLKAIEKKGYTTPSPIQAGVIPIFLQTNRDILGQAQTGTGKTAAFALPILDKIDTRSAACQAIILTPTRELAIQVANEISSFEVPNAPRLALLYGGNDMRGEQMDLKRNPHIVVGTPGRVHHHLRKGTLNLDNLQVFVLDEADEMLNFGFREEIEEILKSTPAQKRVLLFSATMPPSLLNIVHSYMKNPETVAMKSKAMTGDNITQKAYCVSPNDKFEALCRVMEMEERFYAIVFCRTKMETDAVASQLMAHHLKAEAIHGDIEQNIREKVLQRFRDGKTNILVATDVAARGIDIENLDFVVNYSLPETYEAYTHRIGRTGRAGKKGVAITLVSRNDVSRLSFFEKKLGIRLERAKLPKIEDIIETQKKHLVNEVNETLKENLSSLADITKKLLEISTPEKVIAALLKSTYNDALDMNAYRNIMDDFPDERFGGGGSDRGGSSRSGGRSRSFGGGGAGGASRSGGGYRGGDSRSSGGGYQGGGARSGGGSSYQGGGSGGRSSSGGGYGRSGGYQGGGESGGRPRSGGGPTGGPRRDYY